VTVQFATADGSATAGADYVSVNGTLTFAPGERSKTIEVAVVGDTVAEANETFTLALTNPTGGVGLGRASATGTIVDDDAGVSCTPRPRVQTSTAAGGGRLTVVVEPTPLNTQRNNRVVSLRFGTLQNARVTVSGLPVTSGQTVTPPANALSIEYSVERVTPGQATTVPFTVVDACGEWQTFVGGGAAAGF
jgi:chitinase